MYEVHVLADSLHPNADNARLTTLEVVFPRFILAEVNTHRALSRNSASSRAIPTEKFIDSITENPFVPQFNERVKGMGVGEAFDADRQLEAETIWRKACNDALSAANSLMKLGVDKSRANRLLEPFMWHTAIITATEWDNFFALRTHESAQPEFRIIAQMMQEAIENNRPVVLGYDEWHLPLIDDADYREYGFDFKRDIYSGDWDSLKDISVGRLARRSSYNRADPEPCERSIERCKALRESGHWSPFEHVARPMTADHMLIRELRQDWSGNFFGWHQYRKDFAYEDNFAKIGAGYA